MEATRHHRRSDGAVRSGAPKGAMLPGGPRVPDDRPPNVDFYVVNSEYLEDSGAYDERGELTDDLVFRDSLTRHRASSLHARPARA